MRAMWAMMQRQQLGGWLCLLAMVLHLLAPLGHGCPRFDVDARDRLMTVSATGTEGGIAFPPTSRSYYDNPAA